MDHSRSLVNSGERYSGHVTILGSSVSGDLDEAGNLLVCCQAVSSSCMGDDRSNSERETGEAKKDM